MCPSNVESLVTLVRKFGTQGEVGILMCPINIESFVASMLKFTNAR